jgi:GT2 family glycosyltransferase
MLMPRATLTRCGTPSEDFFMWGEDTDYALRITQWRPGYLVGRSRALHLRGVSGDLDIFTEYNPRRIASFYYLYRNTTFLRRTYWPAHGFFLFLGKAVQHFLRAFTQRHYRLLRAKTILGGTLAGLFFHPRYVPLVEDAAPRREAAATPAQGR